MNKIRVGTGITVKSGRPSNIKVSEDGAFKGSQPEINFTGAGVNVSNDPENNKVNVDIPGGSSATGDVTGPASSIVGDMALFDNLTGTLLKVLSGSNDDFAQRKSGVWVNRSLSQVRTDMFDQKKYARFYSDFGAMLAPFVNSASGTGATAAISSIAGTAANPGTATCQTGSTSTGQAYITLSASFNNFLLGGGSWFYDSVQYVNVLSTVSERFVVVVGYHDSPSTSDATDGCYFRYSDNVNGGNWQAITRSNSTETGTVTDTGVAPSAATYQRFTIEVNAAGTQVTYYINGIQVAQHSANIPTGAGRQSTWCTGIRKTAGSTAMSIIVDYMNIINELTTAR